MQEDFILMISVTLEKDARNVLMDLLFNLTKRQEHQSKIAKPVQKVTIEIFFQSKFLILIVQSIFPFLLPKMSSLSITES